MRGLLALAVGVDLLGLFGGGFGEGEGLEVAGFVVERAIFKSADSGTSGQVARTAST